MKITAFLQRLGFKQAPQAWGGSHESGAILIRTWSHEVEHSPHRVGVLLPIQDFSRYRQTRKTHLQQMWRGQVAGYTIVVKRKPGTDQIGEFPTDVIYPITELVGDESGIFAVLAPALPVDELPAHMKSFRVQANPFPEPSFLEKRTGGTGWSDEELGAAVLAYTEMLGKQAAATSFRKADYYAKLAAQFGRAPGAFERRMQNISHLLELKGLPWLSGLKPQGNVGKNVEPRLSSILATLSNPPRGFDFPEEIGNTEGVFEGAQKQIVVNGYERDPNAKSRCLTHWGHSCAVCNFDFESVYGALGRGFIHVHHLKPLSTIRETYLLNPEEDLRPVCPNCHAMLHRKRDQVLSIEELRAIVKSSREHGSH